MTIPDTPHTDGIVQHAPFAIMFASQHGRSTDAGSASATSPAMNPGWAPRASARSGNPHHASAPRPKSATASAATIAVATAARESATRARPSSYARSAVRFDESTNIGSSEDHAKSRVRARYAFAKRRGLDVALRFVVEDGGDRLRGVFVEIVNRAIDGTAHLFEAQLELRISRGVSGVRDRRLRT